MTRRLFTILVCTSLLLGLATPVAADDPVDPAGQPLESSAEDEGEVGVLAEVPTGAHDEFEDGDVFVAVSGGKVQWRLPDGTLNKVLDTGAGGFTTGMAFRRADKHLFVTSFGTNQVFEFDSAGDLVGPFGSGFNSAPESIVFDRQGNMYVGQADGTADVLPNGAISLRRWPRPPT